ncbi:hypothetical protein K501DRAFT_272171 [Backusella circina FSU 941]|nr:hypothetical protein K501DRAFT_272171 [Backusella circina FSU 941]
MSIHGYELSFLLEMSSVITDLEDSPDENSDEDISHDVLECSISKITHTRFMKEAFDNADVFVSIKATHVPRGSGAKIADSLDVISLQIQRMGCWNTESMSTSYLDSLLREFIRVMVGFQTDAVHHLPRAEEEPCD